MELEDAQRAVSDAYDAFGLDCGLESFETVFFLTDSIRSTGFVSTHPKIQVGRIISDISIAWYTFLHGLLVPNPQSFLMTRESHGLSDDVKTRVSEHMDLLARHHRMAQYGCEWLDDAALTRAVRSIVELRFGSLAALFEDVHREIDIAWSKAPDEGPDPRTYG